MNRSLAIAGGIFVMLSLYMLSGLVGCGGADADARAEEPINDSLGKAMMTVRVAELTAIEIPREIVAPGRTEPARRLIVRAESSGTVRELVAARGESTTVGAPLIRLALDERPERVAAAKAEVEARRIDFSAAERLASQQLASGSVVAAASAALTGAEEALARAELDLARATLLAPFAGVLSKRWVEVGDFVQAGDPVVEILELDPLVVAGEVTELEVDHVRVGEAGRARLADGTTLHGRIRFVDTDADPATRTFTVELEVANPGSRLPSGKTAEIVIETELVPAYEVSAAHVSIDDDGRFGVKYVDEENVVRFAEVDIVKSTPRSLWLTGLPAQLRLITVGQGFTKPGDAVDVVVDPSNRE